MVTGIGGRDGRGGRDRHVVSLQYSGNEEAIVKRSTTKERAVLEEEKEEEGVKTRKE